MTEHLVQIRDEISRVFDDCNTLAADSARGRSLFAISAEDYKDLFDDLMLKVVKNKRDFMLLVVSVHNVFDQCLPPEIRIREKPVTSGPAFERVKEHLHGSEYYKQLTVLRNKGGIPHPRSERDDPEPRTQALKYFSPTKRLQIPESDWTASQQVLLEGLLEELKLIRSELDPSRVWPQCTSVPSTVNVGRARPLLLRLKCLIDGPRRRWVILAGAMLVLCLTYFAWPSCPPKPPNAPFVLGGLIALAGESSSQDLNRSCECIASSMIWLAGSTDELLAGVKSLQREHREDQRMALREKIIDQVTRSVKPADAAQVQMGFGSVGLLRILSQWDHMEQGGRNPNLTATLYLIDLEAGLQNGGFVGAPFEALRSLRPGPLLEAKGRAAAMTTLREVVDHVAPGSVLSQSLVE